MKKAAIRIGVITLLVALCPEMALAQLSICGRTGPDIADLERQIVAEKAEQLAGIVGFSGYSDRQNSIVWAFTLPEHPANPALACSFAEVRNGETVLSTRISCNAMKAKCDQLAEDYKKLHKDIAKRLGVKVVD